jgi:phage shock protein PspC (stress-responsive transcriptional regulator)
MNEHPQPISEPQPSPRRFLRSRDERWIGGVCGGLGRYFGVDPLLFRVGAVALAFVGGAALFVYALLWLVVPTDDGSGAPSGPSPLRRLLGGVEGRVTAGRVAAIVAAAVGAVVATVALIGGAVWATAVGGGIWVAIAVIAIGAAAVVAAINGRRRAAWLLVPALLIAAPAGLAAAADVRFQGGFGDRSYQPTALAGLPANGYKLAAGRLRVDLRGISLPPGTTTDLPIQVGMGVATIIVPPSVCVQSNTRVGAGYVDVLGDAQGGLGVRDAVSGARSSAPRLQLQAKVGIGAIEVVHRPLDARFLDNGSGGHSSDAAAGDNAACGAVSG